MAEFKFGHVAPGGATRNKYTERLKNNGQRVNALTIIFDYGHRYCLFRPQAKRVYFANVGLGEAEI